ncbi:PREDICTED: uncharacterized protein LOC106810929 [Priapulus caudatus]|uniref:Uncharacterized protein LOC106810929 n=1 Tax=Priapulus caudatus TaxID=37621 RepID=A0ABM1ECH7_PRICU|nr:PREDICTED: uncharacterized protein LOC106810929 [Priapulus caudatus]
MVAIRHREKLCYCYGGSQLVPSNAHLLPISVPLIMGKKWACNVCKKNCSSGCIYCQTCRSWTHFECQEIEKTNQDIWAKLEGDYICKACHINYDGSFDYLMGLERLKQAAKQGMTKLTCIARREWLLLKEKKVVFELPIDFAHCQNDPVSEAIIADTIQQY